MTLPGQLNLPFLTYLIMSMTARMLVLAPSIVLKDENLKAPR